MGDFPNVPFIGLRDCINYNPILAVRLLGYPMVEKLEDEALKRFVLHDMGANDSSMLQRIIRSWGKVNKKGMKITKRSRG
jgi:hypothetical protein